jgi:hypothetical protein
MGLIYNEIKADLFSLSEKYYLAHCVSADYVLGAGIAVEFAKRFDMRRFLRTYGSGKYPACIKADRVFNLVTKEKCNHKPTMKTLEASLILLRGFINSENIKYLAMPKIGCGLDGLNWEEVRELIKKTFADTDIEITVCYIR